MSLTDTLTRSLPRWLPRLDATRILHTNPLTEHPAQTMRIPRQRTGGPRTQALFEEIAGTFLHLIANADADVVAAALAAYAEPAAAALAMDDRYAAHTAHLATLTGLPIEDLPLDTDVTGDDGLGQWIELDTDPEPGLEPELEHVALGTGWPTATSLVGAQ